LPLLRQGKDFLTFGGLNLDLFLRHAEVDELGRSSSYVTWAKRRHCQK
jgi:hypothetical protein